MPSVTVIKARDDLLAGTEQEVEIVVRTGSMAFQNVYVYTCIEDNHFKSYNLKFWI